MTRLLAALAIMLIPTGAMADGVDANEMIRDAEHKRWVCRGTYPGPEADKACAEATEAEFRLAASGYCIDDSRLPWRKGKAKPDSIFCVK